MRPARPALLLLTFAAACSAPSDAQPHIAEIYQQAAQVETRNPVVVIHGILGARLMQRSTGKTVWGAFTSAGVDPETAEGARALALPLATDAHALPQASPDDDVYAAGPLGKLEVGLLFQVFAVRVYADILKTLGVGGYRDPVLLDPGSVQYAPDHFTCFSFFYDWRRDNVANALALHAFLQARRKDIDWNARQKIARLRQDGTPTSLAEAQALQDWLARGYKFDLVAHSMGGLIARYYLQYGAHDLPADGSTPPITWEGSKEIDRLVLVGTPNLGSMEAWETLLQGFQKAFFLPRFDPALLGTMPSIYQLMPRTRHGLLQGEAVDLYDAAAWEQNQWGLLAPNADAVLQWLLPEVSDPAARRARARACVAACLQRARQFHAALDQTPTTPSPARIHLFAADTQPTLLRATLRREGGRTVPDFAREPRHLGLGDGTVPRYSAVADERQGGEYRPGLRSSVPWTHVTWLSDDHLGLTRNPQFTDNLLFLLLEQ